MKGSSIGNSFKGPLRERALKYVIVLVLALCIGIFGIINPVFLTGDNILNILWQNAYLVVATIGMTFIMVGGGVDLAAGFELGLGAIVMAACLVGGLPIWAAIVAGVAACVVMSAVNGIAVIKLKINAMMVTLATMTIYSGVSFIVTNSKAIYNLPAEFKVIGQGSFFGVIPISAVIMVVLIALASFILNFTFFGRYVYAVGGNAEAAHLAGINVAKVRLLTFALGGFFFGVAALLLVSRTGSASSAMASGTEFTCITAAVLGGVALQGGEGKLWSVVVSVFILGVLANGMQIIGLGVYPQYIAKGLILLASMGFNAR
jgi:ribose/xylose/arabinose/galactoside ABC-type transport system permease subunit